MAEARQAQSEAAATAPVVESTLLDRVVEEGRLGLDEEEKKKGREWIQAFLQEILTDNIRVKSDTDAMLTERIKQIDQLLSDQLNEILHHEKFQAVESTWRGIHYLTQQTETSPMLKIKVMNLNKRELLLDLRN